MNDIALSLVQSSGRDVLLWEEGIANASLSDKLLRDFQSFCF